jgi:Domain of unknown function (DUF4157)
MFEQGRPLSLEERQIFRPYFPQNVLEKARIMDGVVPFWLRRNMCAVVLGCRIYFRPHVYWPNTKRGVELLGHELTHVSQFLHGMSLVSYLWSCRYGYRNSPYEVEAYAKGALIARLFDEKRH